MLQSLVLWICATTALFAVHCGNSSPPAQFSQQPGTVLPSPSPSPSPSPVARPATFTQVSRDILQPRCVSCHTPPGASAGLDLTTYAGVLTAVTPGDPQHSLIFEDVTNGAMPPGGPLTAAQIEELRSWIASGAPNN